MSADRHGPSLYWIYLLLRSIVTSSSVTSVIVNQNLAQIEVQQTCYTIPNSVGEHPLAMPIDEETGAELDVVQSTAKLRREPERARYVDKLERRPRTLQV